MKFAVGYQLPDADDSIVEIVRDHCGCVSEVYFAWPHHASGRSALTGHDGRPDREVERQLESDLLELRRAGVKLDLLFNANCYGARAVSRQLESEVISLLAHLEDLVGGVEVVTTTSPAVARTVKRNFPAVDVRASVNMRIGTIQAMEYVSGLFDSFYVQRDFNRDLEHIRRVKSWADSRGKGLCLLANSGCLRFCPGQTFHDNLVAHEAEVSRQANIEDWNPLVCWRLLRDRGNWAEVLKATWIRPEDLHNYEGLFPTVKLATRMHSRPRMVVAAYAAGRHHGNLLDLLEPGFGPAFAPHILDNDAFPADWFERTSTCQGRCESCDYCRRTMDEVLVAMAPTAVGA
jgi:collagenase-like PrtC family protease